MKRVFWNEDERRLRAGWRIFAFIVAVMVTSQIFLLLAEQILGGRPEPGPRREFLLISAATFSVTSLIPVGRRLLDHRSTLSLGLRFDGLAVKDLIFGYLLSGVMAAAFFFILLSAGILEITGFAWSGGAFLYPVLFSFALHILVGWWEELFFRGYLFDNLVAGLGMTVAVVVSCVLYGVLHAFNPGATLWSTIIIVGFGFMRLFGLLTTEQLWLSMGMHMGWNFFQGTVFGFAASGHETFKLIRHEVTGQPWLSGGDFGPEGSIVMVPIIAAAIGVMYFWSRRTRWSGSE